MVDAGRAEVGLVRAGRALAVATGALAVWAGALAVSAGLTRSAGQAWASSAAPRPEDVVASMAGAGGAAVASWLALGALVTVVSTVVPASGAAGRAVHGWAAAITPELVRRAVGTGLGVAVLTATVPGTALAAHVPSVTTATAPGQPHQGAELDPAWWPTGTAPTGTAPTRTAPTRTAPTGSRAAGLPAAAREPRTVTVRAGDTLWGLAARHLGPDASTAEVSAEWPRWYAANRLAIGPDADLLRPGVRLLVPARLSAMSSRTPGRPDAGRGTTRRPAGAAS